MTPWRSIQLAALMILLATLNGCTAPDTSAPYTLSPEEQARVDQAKQQVLEQNPALKKEYQDLEQAWLSAEQQKRTASYTMSDVVQKLKAAKQEIRDEAVKSDPTLAPLFQKADAETANRLNGGLSEYWDTHKNSLIVILNWPLLGTAVAVLVFIAGLVLLFRPPNLGSANLLLAAALLPAVLAGIRALHFVTFWQANPYSETDDPASPIHVLESFRTEVFAGYWASLPALSIYVALLLRIYLRKRPET